MKKERIAIILVILLIVSTLYIGFTIPSSQEDDTTEYEEIEKYVYVTDNGEKYHTKNCYYLKYSKNEITIQEAIEEGYTPCSKCNP